MPTKPKTPCKHPGCPELVEPGRQPVAESKEEIPGGSSAVRGVYEGRSVRESY